MSIGRLCQGPKIRYTIIIIINPTTGNIIYLDDQQLMVSAMAETNRCRQQQCVNTPFFQPPLVDVLGSLIDKENATIIFDSTFVPPLGTPEGAC